MKRLTELQNKIAKSMVRTQSTEDMVAVNEDELDQYMHERGWEKDEVIS